MEVDGEDGKKKKVDWPCVTNDGEVTRPEYGEDDSQGLFYIFPKAAGSTSIYITVLAYQGKITLSEQPQNTTVNTGDTAKLSVEATTEGNPGGDVTYQWYQSESADGANGTLIPGATNPTYTTESLSTPGIYYYYCEASAPDAKTAQSAVAEVTVSAADGHSIDTGLDLSKVTYVYAASYAADGKMVDIQSGKIIGQSSVVEFQKELQPGDCLFFLDENSVPVYGKKKVSELPTS